MELKDITLNVEQQIEITAAVGDVFEGLSLCHRVLGLIEDDHRKGVVPGWRHMLERVKSACE